MRRSQKWPDLRSPISKIQDIRFVGTDDLIIFRKFHNFPWNIVAVARWESYFVVGSLDLTWWPDLTWPWAEIFTKVAEKMGGKVGENPAALRTAVFFAILEKPEGGGGGVQTPPPAGSGLMSKGPASRARPFEMKSLIDIKQYSDYLFHCHVFLMHYFGEKVVWECYFEEKVEYQVWYPIYIRPRENG